MRGSRKRRGVSLGTVLMLCVTGMVVLGCAMLLPKLRGNVDVRVNADDIAVVIEDPMGAVAAEATPAATATAVPTAAETAVYATQAPTPVADVGIDYAFTMTVGGTLTFSSAIQKSVLADGQYDFASLLAPISGELQSDVNLFTLENTVVDTQKLGDTNLSPSVLPALKSNGVTALCVGYSGIFNFGTDGAADTMRLMNENGLLAYGVYPTEGSGPTITQVNGVSVAFLSFQSELSSQGKKRTTKEERAYAYYLPTIENITAQVRQARAQGAQVVVVSLYWGNANATKPTDAQRTLAQQAAEAGADIILGAHSDAVQPVELITTTRSDGAPHQTLCAYSLGSTLSANRGRRTQLAGVLLHITATYHAAENRLSFDELTYTPTYIWRSRVKGDYVYRVVSSNRAAPAEMDESQQNVMTRCLQLVQTALTDTPVTEKP